MRERRDDLRLALLLAAALAAAGVPAARRAPLVGQERPVAAPALEPYRVPLNSAPEGELRALPGVGGVLARRIVAERRRAPFADASDLRRVHGIGPSLARRVARHACFMRHGAAGSR